MNHLDDEEIIRIYTYNPNKAFHYLYEKYSSQLYTIALKLTSNQQTAEDIVQETFENIHLSIKGFLGKSSLKTWIYKIFYRVMYKYTANNNKFSMQINFQAVTNNSSTDKTLLSPNAIESKVLVENVLDMLSQDDKILLLLAYLVDLNLNEIAEIFSISLNHVKVNLFRARQKFKIIYEKLSKESKIL